MTNKSIESNKNSDSGINKNMANDTPRTDGVEPRLKPAINYPLTTRDAKGNVTHIEHSDGSEAWKEYDENNNIRHYKDSDGREYWFDSEGNEIPNPNLDPTDK